LGDYGISSGPIRIGYKVAKGFSLNQFTDAFSRYLPLPPSPSVTRLQASIDAGFNVTDGKSVTVTQTSSVTRKPNNDAGCNHVTDGGGVAGDNEETEVLV
jgi:putative DNA primase/helicase